MNYQIPSVKTANLIRKQLRNKHSSFRHIQRYGILQGKTPMWEEFSGFTVISRDKALELVASMPLVYIMWEGSPVSISRKLQKSQMISASGLQAAQALASGSSNANSFTPTDVYCISGDKSFCVVFTRVFVKGVGNICLTSKTDSTDGGISEIVASRSIVT